MRARPTLELKIDSAIASVTGGVLSRLTTSTALLPHPLSARRMVVEGRMDGSTYARVDLAFVPERRRMHCAYVPRSAADAKSQLSARCVL